MGLLIHARERHGRLIFRLFSTNTDTYTTNELNEKKLRELLLLNALWNELDRFDEEIGERIERAMKNGTSSATESKNRKMTDPWEKELKENKSSKALDLWTEQQKAKIPRFRILLKQALVALEDEFEKRLKSAWKDAKTIEDKRLAATYMAFGRLFEFEKGTIPLDHEDQVAYAKTIGVMAGMSGSAEDFLERFKAFLKDFGVNVE